MRLPALLLALAIACAAQSPAPLGRLVDIGGGRRLHLYCTGEGAPVVMVVGAGFSFDWALVQPKVAKLTTICTYDSAGTAWSTGSPPPDCRARAAEVRQLARSAGLSEPLVLVGLSIGACVARLYAAEFPSQVAGLVLVDHAFSPDRDPARAHSSPAAPNGPDSPPAVISQTPIALTVEDISQFQQLPSEVRDLHRWAASLHPKLPTWADAEDCLAQLKRVTHGPFPLGDLPLAVVSTGNQAPGYERLQNELLALSHRSIQLLADRSFHAVEIDQPDVVAAAIRHILEQARKP